MLNLIVTFLLAAFSAIGVYEVLSFVWTAIEIKRNGCAEVTKRDTYICIATTFIVVFVLLYIV